MVFLGEMSGTRVLFEGRILERICGEWTAGCLCGIGMISVQLKIGSEMFYIAFFYGSDDYSLWVCLETEMQRVT